MCVCLNGRKGTEARVGRELARVYLVPGDGLARGPECSVLGTGTDLQDSGPCLDEWQIPKCALPYFQREPKKRQMWV